jgi:rSAM/selenodomain-associated transferase 1
MHSRLHSILPLELSSFLLNPTDVMDAALLVFAKAPRPGQVKTRLTPVLTPSEAARLYDAFLRDALQLYTELAAEVQLYLAPPLPDEPLSGLPDSVSVFEQAGEGLGGRMKHAFHDTLDEGYNRVSVVGTDHPTLPLSFIRQSFGALDPSRSVCIGPSEDGGFYLLGMNAFYPQLFEGMSYSHERVFTDTLARVGTTDARLTVLPRWYDVDTPASLEQMIGDLEDEDVEAPRTRKAVQELQLHHLSSTEDG